MLVPFGKDPFSGTSNVLGEKVILTALFQPGCSLLLMCSFCFLFNPHRAGWQKAQLSNCKYTASTQLASKGNDFSPRVPISSGKRIYAASQFAASVLSVLSSQYSSNCYSQNIYSEKINNKYSFHKHFHCQACQPSKD